jgi:hypothetical protein
MWWMGWFGCRHEEKPTADPDPTDSDTGHSDPGHSDPTEPPVHTDDTGVARPFTWSPLGPATGGFVSAVAFDPRGDGTVWVSGDDGSGLWRREPGGAFELVPSSPADWATYTFAFDPRDPDTLHAPSHFGRGHAVTTDGGASFSVVEHAAWWHATVNDVVAVEHGGGTRLVYATSDGLSVSDDDGATVVELPFRAGTPFQAITVEWGGDLLAGDDEGGVHRSTDGGDSWVTLLPPASDGIPVSDLASTPTATYIGYTLGLVARAGRRDLADVQLLDPGRTFGSFLWTRVAATPTGGDDRVWVGTVGPAPWGTHGLFRSDDGGDTFTAVDVQGVSVFSLAVDPVDADHVVVTAVNGPVLETTDGGDSFQDAPAVLAWSSLGLAQDEGDPDHLLLGSTTGIPENGRLFETVDGGVTWEESRPDVEPYGLAVAGDVALMGGFSEGGIRRREGDGPWTTALESRVGFREFVQDPTDPDRWVALTSESSTALLLLGAWESLDGGRTWAQLLSGVPFTAAFVPASSTLLLGEADVSAVGSSGTRTSLGLEDQLGGDLVTRIDFAQDAPDTILVGTLSGALFAAEGCDPEAPPCTWRALPSPLREALANVVAGTIDEPGVWFVSGAAADVGVGPDSVDGVFRSDDRGATWVPADETLVPCQMVWRLRRDAAGGLLAGLWGAGAARFGAPR